MSLDPGHLFSMFGSGSSNLSFPGSFGSGMHFPDVPGRTLCLIITSLL